MIPNDDSKNAMTLHACKICCVQMHVSSLDTIEMALSYGAEKKRLE